MAFNWRIFAICIAATFVFGALIVSIGTNVKADQARGLALVKENCGECHATEATDASPHESAPPFREIVKRYPPESLEESLAEGIVTGHADMPEFTLEPDEIGDVIAYLNTLI